MQLHMDEISIVVTFLLLQSADTSLSSSGQSVSPCLGRFSIFQEGQCVHCLNPISTITCTNYADQKINVSMSRFDICTEPVVMCPTDLSFINEARINKGKHFFNKGTLRVVTIERPPFVKVVKGGYGGVVFELINALRGKYNFSQNVFLPYDGNWGAKDANSTWNEMVGQVLRKEADLAAAPFSITEERSKVIQFSMAFHQEPAAVLIPAPTSGNKLATLIKPFAPEVWSAVFCTVCVLGPSLFVMHVISLRIRGQIHMSKEINSFGLITDLFQFIIGSFVQEISPVNKTTRFTVAIWWFSTLVLANIYTGQMVSYLSVPKLYDIVDSVEGLVQQTKLRWTYRKHTALEELFQSNVSTTYRAIGTGARDLVTSDHAGVDRVLMGNFAFIKEKSFLDVAIGEDFEKTNQCRITVASQTFFNIGFAFVVQKGSAILDLIDAEILNVVTTGLMEKWKSRHWPHNLYCVNAASYIISTQPKTRRLTLDDCQGAYFLLLCGIFLASLGFSLEMGYYCKKEGKIYRKERSDE